MPSPNGYGRHSFPLDILSYCISVLSFVVVDSRCDLPELQILHQASFVFIVFKLWRGKLAISASYTRLFENVLGKTCAMRNVRVRFQNVGRLPVVLVVTIFKLGKKSSVKKNSVLIYLFTIFNWLKLSVYYLARLPHCHRLITMEACVFNFWSLSSKVTFRKCGTILTFVIDFFPFPSFAFIILKGKIQD